MKNFLSVKDPATNQFKLIHYGRFDLDVVNGELWAIDVATKARKRMYWGNAKSLEIELTVSVSPVRVTNDGSLSLLIRTGTGIMYSSGSSVSEIWGDITVNGTVSF